MASKRKVVPSKIIDLEEFRIERAIDLKTRRAGHLGDVTKKLNYFKICSLVEQVSRKYFEV